MRSKESLKQIKNPIQGEGGFVLILALVILFVTGVLASMVFSISSPEAEISRNYRTRQDAFYAAERAMEYAKSDSNIYATIGSGTVNIPLGGVSLASGSSNASGTVAFLANGNPPRGSGMDVTQFQANYFVIDVTGTGSGNANVEVEANVAKIIPRD